ncbi:IS21-like element helper ATPase IstB [Streptomyces sp. NPDC096046]|uniref:IS21-like element helper ATPase IstB n=1 Tax=Streptomyces sp. NPDC096046 TaxID=3155542 RepID=UPI00331772C0
MQNPTTTTLGYALFATRWLQAPLYFGLVAAQGVYVYKFFKELWTLILMCVSGHATETYVMLAVLKLVDVVMIANLLIMVIVGGYETFVSRIGLQGHRDQPEWLSHVNSNVLKVKLATAIVGISSVHLLQMFVDVHHTSRHALLWGTVIHMAFIASAAILACMSGPMVAHTDRGHADRPGAAPGHHPGHEQPTPPSETTQAPTPAARRQLAETGTGVPGTPAGVPLRPEPGAAPRPTTGTVPGQPGPGVPGAAAGVPGQAEPGAVEPVAVGAAPGTEGPAVVRAAAAFPLAPRPIAATGPGQSGPGVPAATVAVPGQPGPGSDAEARIRAAGFPARKLLEDFDQQHLRDFDRDAVARLGKADFVAARRNVVFVGPPGTGKTHLAIALGVRACQAGHRVLFATAAEWAGRLADARAAGRLDEELTALDDHPLLIVDEVGYTPFDAATAGLFFRLVAHRYERASLIVTSDRSPGRWDEVFGPSAPALTDRLAHHADLVRLEGDSYRTRRATSAWAD